MIKTEARRAVVHSNVQLPSDVRKALDRYNATAFLPLDLIYNDDRPGWEIYSIKAKGLTYADDLLHWQMSAPTTGTAISFGIIDWVRQFDTSQGGKLSKEELKDNWLKEFISRALNLKQKEKEKCDDEYSQTMGLLINDLRTGKSVSGPVLKPIKIVGHGRNGPIYAVPRGSAQAVRVNKKKLADQKLNDRREVSRERFGF